LNISQNVIKIDHYSFELYHFKVGAFFETQCILLFPFYRAMHFSAKRGIAIACRLSVCPSVCLWRWWIV